ncbi:MAG: hypothetical protein KGI38_03735 [Thaumarchaeota archaeon]|nr:hypothetical protein [Nitrososphaerota archaeon]
MKSTNWPLWVLALLSIGAPSAILTLDRAKDIQASGLMKKMGLPAFVLFILLLGYSYAVGDPIFTLLVWGAVGGLLGTITLDAVRLTGLRLRAFPLDMPVMFGLMSLGIAPKLPRHVMANMVATASAMPDEKRMEMMEPRIRAMSELAPPERKLFMSMMLDGINRLPGERKDRMFKTQLEVISSLPEEKRLAMMRTMDELTMGVRDPGGLSAPVSPMAVFRRGAMPMLSLSMGRDLLAKAIPETLNEEGATLGKVRAAGYAWHFVNGATYGMAFTLLFGMGSWPWVLAWGLFVDLVMMVGMPPMMPMIRLPYPRFLVVPYLAHLAMAVPIGYFALSYVSPIAAAAGSLLGGSLLAGNTYVTLTLLPTIVFILLSAIILLGYKAYTRPIYGKRRD